MEQTVHIVPQGWEHDRVVEPALAARAHRVYLLARRDHEQTEVFIDRAVETLEEDEIDVDVVDVDHEREFESTLLHVAQLLRRESENGNRVFVNMSSGGKIAAVASSLATMFHADRAGGIYYAKPEEYLVGLGEDNGGTDGDFEDHGLTAGYEGMRELPSLQLNKPSMAGIRTLVSVYREGAMTFDDILRVLHQHEIEPYDDEEVLEILDAEVKSEVRKDRQRWVQRLRRSVISELDGLGLVTETTEGIGGKLHFGLTEDGEYYALASGLVDELRTGD